MNTKTETRRFKSPRDQRFRAAADEVIRSTRRIRDHIHAVKDFYLGRPGAAVPPVNARLETVLNPKCNGACPCFEHLTLAAKEYRTGEYPPDVLELLHTTTLDLIHNEIEPIQRTSICNKLITLVEDFHTYLSTPAAVPRFGFDMEAHCRKLDKFCAQWNKCCCQNSDAFYEKTTSLIAKRESPAPVATSEAPRKKSKITDWRKNDPALLKRREDTKRVIYEIRRRHQNNLGSYTKIIRQMMKDPVWNARMKSRSMSSWKTSAINCKV